MRHGELARSVSAKVVWLVGLSLVAVWLRATHVAAGARQTGAWTLVHERPSSVKYEDFAFPNSKDGWLVSADGVILHTADSGVTWEVQATGKGRLRSVDFLDPQRGFAGTVIGVLYGTTDGGVTWTDITKDLPHAPGGFCGMTHVGEQVHMVGRYYGGVTDYFFSPDGGKTWRWSDLGERAQALVDVSFVSNSVGFIGGMARTGPPGAGPALILKTTDGGKSWRQVFAHDGGRGYAWKVFPISARLIYASLQSQDGIYRIVKSTDGGDTWAVMTVATGQPQRPGVQGIGFLDENTGWVGGFFQGMYATTDGGHTWTQVTLMDRTINRFERVGRILITAGTRGVLRYDPR
jgi:photosystem II stability/assembly factor-like uncharacterized protein